LGDYREEGMTHEEFDRLMQELNDHISDVQYFDGKRWLEWGGPILGKFRLKPKPREVWIHEGDIGKALRLADGPAPSDRFRKFREVIDD
jgi:hypothetical protein